MVEFAYNNRMHSSTQQTPFFANHNLHPKLDIQGVNKVLNPTVKDQNDKGDTLLLHYASTCVMIVT
jgi:hypothetical protein